MPSSFRPQLTILPLLCILVNPVSVRGSNAEKNKDSGDPVALTLEELMEVPVTSVAKKRQKLSESPAAVTVISSEDIKRSGATSIPELLRSVPGLHVARIDSNKWAVSSRGFNGRFSNKLLVLIDGRSSYTPLFSGVYWEVQDTFLEDIDRIEVIRGPGSALWGANAVNGVVNIITKHARETQGGLLSFGAGTEEIGFGGMRYGFKLQDNSHLRVYGKYFNRDNLVGNLGGRSSDRWDALRAGFRLDWEGSGSDHLTLQGDLYDAQAGQGFSFMSPTAPFRTNHGAPAPIDMSGGNVLAAWRRPLASSEMRLQVYYDRTQRADNGFIEQRDTLDVEFQQGLDLGSRNELLFGFGYRFSTDNINSLSSLMVVPDKRSDNLLSAFVQDELRLVDDRLRLTLGSRFERNSYTGFEIQPSVRALWVLRPRHSVWAAVSRAVRTPSRVEHDFRMNRPVPVDAPPSSMPLPNAAMVFFGNPSFRSEELVAYEVGYRFPAQNQLTLDIAGFWNVYDNLKVTEAGEAFFETSSGSPYIALPFWVENGMQGDSHGLELNVDWTPSNWWRLQVAYTYFEMDLRSDSEPGAPHGRSGPRHQAFLRPSLELPGALPRADLRIRYVDELVGSIPVSGYVACDVQLAWKLGESWQLSLVGQNLLEPHHLEFVSELDDNQPVEVERGIYFKASWEY